MPRNLMMSSRVKNWCSITVFPHEHLAIAKFVCEIDPGTYSPWKIGILAIPVIVGERGKQVLVNQA